MKKHLFLVFLLALPLFIFAEGNCFGLHESSFGQAPQMQGDRAYRVNQRTDQWWTYATNSWTNAYQRNYYYVSNFADSPDSVGVYYWFPDTSSFNLSGVYHLTYDTSGEYVTHIVLSRSSGGEVIIDGDYSFSYSPQGYLTGYQRSAPGGEGGFGPLDRMAIQYVSPSNYEIYSWTFFNTDGVPEWSHTNFLWDAQGRIIQETTQTSLDSLTWVNSQQVTREYLAGDTTTGMSFINNLSHQFPFLMIGGDDASPYFGLQTHNETKSWNNNQWVNRNKQDFTYNGSNILISDLTSKWQGGTWRNEDKNEYLYDANNNLIEITTTSWSNSSQAWINDHRSLYNWSNYTSSGDDALTPQIQSINAYPNPSGQASTVTFAAKLPHNERGSLVIYNLKGQIVKTMAISADSPNATWNSKNEQDQPCAAGVYFYRLVTNKHTQTRKLVILK